VIGVVRVAGDGKLLSRDPGEEGEGQFAQQVVGGEREVNPCAPPADLAGGVHAVEVVAEKIEDVGGNRVVFVVEAVGAGVVAEGAELEGAGVAAHGVVGFQEPYVEPGTAPVQARRQPGGAAAENCKVGGEVSAHRHTP
jgi:hypothetical protein